MKHGGLAWMRGLNYWYTELDEINVTVNKIRKCIIDIMIHGKRTKKVCFN